MEETHILLSHRHTVIYVFEIDEVSLSPNFIVQQKRKIINEFCDIKNNIFIYK